MYMFVVCVSLTFLTLFGKSTSKREVNFTRIESCIDVKNVVKKMVCKMLAAGWPLTDTAHHGGS